MGHQLRLLKVETSFDMHTEAEQGCLIKTLNS
jgi:hypothetical protein